MYGYMECILGHKVHCCNWQYSRFLSDQSYTRDPHRTLVFYWSYHWLMTPKRPIHVGIYFNASCWCEVNIGLFVYIMQISHFNGDNGLPKNPGYYITQPVYYCMFGKSRIEWNGVVDIQTPYNLLIMKVIPQSLDQQCLPYASIRMLT